MPVPRHLIGGCRELFRLVGFWTALAEMLVPASDRVALSGVRRYPVRSIACPLEPGRRDPVQPAPFPLLYRNPCPRPLLYVHLVAPASEAPATAPARQDQTSSDRTRICGCGDELDLSHREPLNRDGNPQETQG
jgi:hypothetical protein